MVDGGQRWCVPYGVVVYGSDRVVVWGGGLWDWLDAKTAIRQIRRDANEEIKKLEKDGKSSEDDARRARDEIQKVTDKHTSLVDEISKNKEGELLEI